MEKRSSEIKGRTVSGGNKQRDFISKEDARSPIVATESVLLTCIIESQEERDVAVVDIHNTLIQTKVESVNDMATIWVRGELVDALLEIAPEVYGPYVTKDKKGNKVLILPCKNAIYGTMVASILYYRKFCETLFRCGFELNLYDACVANRKVDGKQQTVCCHMDNCKISHVDYKVNDELIDILRQEYERIFNDVTGKITVHRGKEHKYLGMKLDYRKKGVFQFTIFEYIKETLDTSEKMEPKAKGTKNSAAPGNLFIVREDFKKLDAKKAEKFHSIVANFLFATKRSRTDTGSDI